MKNTILIYLKNSWVYLLAMLAPLLSSVVAVMLLIGIDMIVAIYVAHKLGEAITSRKMSMSISKILLYNAAILSAFLCQTYLLAIIPFVKTTLGLIAMTEFKSISESIQKLLSIDLFGSVKSWLSRNNQNINKP